MRSHTSFGTRFRYQCLGVIAALVAGAFGSSPITASASTGTNPPIIVVTTPKADQLFYLGSLTFQGSASDDVAVRSVGIGIQLLQTRQWLQADGTFALTKRLRPALLSNPRTPTTNWTLTIPSLPSGAYSLSVTATDVTRRKTSMLVNFGNGPTPTASTPGYLTLLFGRVMWTASDSLCNPFPGQPTLLQIAQDLQALTPSRVGAGVVVTGWIGMTAEKCVGSNLYSSWADLDALRDQFGWTMSSEGLDHISMRNMTMAQLQAETCGSLTAINGLYAHGHSQAWSMFAYPNNVWTAAIQSDPVNGCFAFGRTYGAGRNVQPTMAQPWLQSTASILGGTCNIATDPCAKKIVLNQLRQPIYYHSLTSITNLMAVAGDEWVVVQMYRMVVGAASGLISWDCTASDWRLHWTSQPELYCYNDYLAAVSAIPPNVITVDPGFVARAWNSNPTVSQRPAPLVQGVAPAGGIAAGGSTAVIAGEHLTGTARVSFGSTPAASFTVDSDNQITAVSPAGSGNVDIIVTTLAGQSARTAADQFSYVPGPTVAAVTPSTGPEVGGTSVTITGSGFNQASAVSFGSTPAASFTVDSDTQITAVSPAGNGNVEITVTTLAGQSATTAADQFSYVPAPMVAAITPGTGPEVGGTSVTITGSGFNQASAVGFGSTPATSFTIDSDTQITAVSPAGSGTVDVTVTSLFGQSAPTAADQFSYTA